jgi:DNA-binding CsgD family transcriptional regulator
MSAMSLERRFARDPHLPEEISFANQPKSVHAACKRPVEAGLEPARRMADALSAPGHAIALIDGDGCVVHMNTRFRRLIGDGIHLKAERLASWEGDADRALSAAIARAIQHDGSSGDPAAAVVLPRRLRARPLVAQVVPVFRPACETPGLIAALVMLRDLEWSSAGPLKAVLQRAFGFTPAEAHLAGKIAQGRTLADIARQDGAALETLRTRLKSVFDKTGTRRQTELALLLSKITLPAD